MIQSLLCSVDFDAVLPLLNNKAEAESILGVVVLGYQLDAEVTSLIATTKHCAMLDSIHRSILATPSVADCNTTSSSNACVPGNKFNRAMRPLLARTMELSKERNPVQLDHIASILEELRKAEASLRQYGTQNKALAKELDSQAPKLASNKKKLSQIEIGLCDRMQAVIRLASDETSLQSPDFMGKLEELEGSVGSNSPYYRSRRKRSRRGDSADNLATSGGTSTSTSSRASHAGADLSFEANGGVVKASMESPAFRLYQPTSTGSSAVKDNNETEAAAPDRAAGEGECEEGGSSSVNGASGGGVDGRKRARLMAEEEEENDPTASQNSSSQVSAGGAAAGEL